jgi:nicotinamidase-related amidase
VVDVQHFSVFPGQGDWSHVDPGNIPSDMRYYLDWVRETVIPNIARYQAAFRRAGSNEIIIPKSSSRVFNSTNIDDIPHNLEFDYLAVWPVWLPINAWNATTW